MNRAMVVLVATSVACASSQETSDRMRRPPVITEIALYYAGDDGRSHALSIDPAHVDVLFLDSLSLHIYKQGLPANERAFVVNDVAADSLLVQQSNFFRPSRDTVSAAGGAIGAIVFRAGGQWYRIAGSARTHTAVVHYEEQGKRGGPFYELRLPLRPATIPDGDPDDTNVDVLLWNQAAFNIYRQGMPAAGRTVRVPRHARLNGMYHKIYDGYDRALFMPDTLGRPGLFRSVTSELCYHFEACQWTCVAEPL